MSMPTENNDNGSVRKATPAEPLRAWQDANFRAQCREGAGQMPEPLIRIVSERTPDPTSVVIYPPNESK